MEIIYYILFCGSKKIDNNMPKFNLGIVVMQFQFFVFPIFFLFYKLHQHDIFDFYGYFNKQSGSYRIASIFVIIFGLFIFNYFNYFRKEKRQNILKKYDGKYNNLINHSFFLSLFLGIIAPLLGILFIELLFILFY